MNISPGLAMLAMLATLSGCAFGTRHATLSYPPESDGDGGLIASAHADEPPVEHSRGIVLRVSDQRAARDRVGNVRNTFGMDTADVVTSDDVRAWVEGALRHELTNAGYTVVPTSDAAEDQDAIRLTAEIVAVYCDVYMTYDGDVSLVVTLEDGERPPVRKQLAGSGSVGLNWAATGKSYAKSLALALQDAIAQILAELAVLD